MTPLLALPNRRRLARFAHRRNAPSLIEWDEGGRHAVTFPDFGRVATAGATRSEAPAEARDPGVAEGDSRGSRRRIGGCG